MSEPPRLRQIFNRYGEVTYFLTFCVEGRKKVLSNDQFYTAFRNSIERLVNWHTWSGVVMPDHVHLLVSPLKEEHSVSDFSAAFKRWTRKECEGQWNWQKGCFDRLLRKSEQAQQKWVYVRENPVRAGLVLNWQKWPYYYDWNDLA